MKSILLFWLCALNAFGVVLEWDRNTETNLAGYRVHWGSESRDYTSTLDVGNTNIVTLPNIPGTTFYAVTAYDTENFENEYSNEVSNTVRFGLRPVQNLRISGTNAVSTIKLLQSNDLTGGGKWTETGQAFVPVSNGPTTFFKAVAPAPAKQFVSAPPVKAGKLIIRQPARPFKLPPMPR